MVATKELALPDLGASDTNERLSEWSTSKNIGVLIMTLVVLTVVSATCIRFVLTPRSHSAEWNQNSAVGNAVNARAVESSVK